MIWTPEQRRVAFESLVLRGIWLLVRLAATGAVDRREAGRFREHALDYFDEVGNQSDGAKQHRREADFPELRLHP